MNQKPTPCPKCKKNPRRGPGLNCLPCEAAWKRAARAKKHGGKSPLQVAHERHERQSFAGRLQSENSALAAENKALKAQLAVVERVTGAAPKVHAYTKAKAGKEDAVACVLASDWHVEEPVAPETVNGLNEYSLDIAKRRAEHFFKNSLKLADIMARETKIQTLFAGFLGDFFTNYLHEENQEMNELPPEEAAEFVQGLLATGIEHWLKESQYKLVIDCIAGNHGRMTKKYRTANHSGTSLETFMYFALAKHFRGNPRVEFRVARSKMLYRQFFEKFNLRLIHGDDIGYQGGIGGITIPIRKKIAGWDKAIRADLTVLGHFHQRFDGGDFMANGSLIGYNAYAQSLGASPEEAQQSFFLVSARNGGQKSVTAPVWLDNAHLENP